VRISRPCGNEETALSPHLASFIEITERYRTLRSVTGLILHLSYYLTSTILFGIRIHRKIRSKQIDIFLFATAYVITLCSVIHLLIVICAILYALKIKDCQLEIRIPTSQNFNFNLFRSDCLNFNLQFSIFNLQLMWRRMLKRQSNFDEKMHKYTIYNI